MRRLSVALIAAVSVVTLTQIATAADLPLKSPPPAPFSWTGFYVGLNAGWARVKSDVSNTSNLGGYILPMNAAGINAAGSFSISDDGFTGGGQIGYNWQTGIWVLGIEGDFNALNTKSSNTLFIPYTSFPINGTRIDNQIDTDWFATIRGRLGVATIADGRALFYVTGGAAFTKINLSTMTFELVPLPNGINCSSTHCGASSGSSTKTGWTVGGGVEWAINRNWSVKGEYLFADFGNVATNTVHNRPNFPTVSVIHTDADLKLQVVRAGLNYRF